jgi:hypothetical protein
MSRRIAFQLMLIGLASAGMACAENPVAPTTPAPLAGGMALQDFRVSQIGLTNAVCIAGFQYLVHDQLTVDITGQTGATLVGATVHQVDDNGATTQIATVNQCTEAASHCGPSAVACLTRSSPDGGQVRIFTTVPWSPTRRYQLFLRSGGLDSNTVSATITRPDNLPFGPNAAIAHIDARREGSDTTGGFHVSAFNPRVAGRRIRLTREVWSNGGLLSSSTTEFQETQPTLTVGVTGGITIAAAPTELVVLLEERDAGGAVIATDRRAMFFR